MTVYLVLGIYYEEDFYRCETIQSANLTLKGAAKRLTELVSTVPYEEYEIKSIDLGE